MHVLVVVLMLLPGIVLAGDVQFLECPQVAFFGSSCVGGARAAGTPLPPDTRPPDLPTPASEPLFTPETMARDTPPAMLRLLEAPTLDNAKAFLAWQQRRLQRVGEVQRLLRSLTKGDTPDAPPAP